MNYIGEYEEISPNNGYPSMRDYMEKQKYDNQDTIVNYLERGKVLGVFAGHSPIDPFSGENINVERGAKTDETYAWPMELAYYVKTYNLRLPSEFEKHILAASA